jgi:hypothetical protein
MKRPLLITALIALSVLAARAWYRGQQMYLEDDDYERRIRGQYPRTIIDKVYEIPL